MTNFIDSTVKNIDRDPSEFNEKFWEQVALLTLACRNFDEGYEYASLHIAVSLRTLLYDNKKNNNFVSILKHIDQQTIKLLDSSLHNEQDVNLGLVSKRYSIVWKNTNPPASDVENSTISYSPLCHGISSSLHEEYRKEANWKTIDDWLAQPICINTNYSIAKLNRLDLIKITADRDGGAHLDKKVDEKYNYFRFGFTGLNEKNRKEWRGMKILNIPIYPILRQIAFEVLYSFKNANLINTNIPIVWSEDFKSLNHMIKSLPLKSGYWTSMSNRLRIFQPDKIKS